MKFSCGFGVILSGLFDRRTPREVNGLTIRRDLSLKSSIARFMNAFRKAPVSSVSFLCFVIVLILCGCGEPKICPLIIPRIHVDMVNLHIERSGYSEPSEDKSVRLIPNSINSYLEGFRPTIRLANLNTSNPLCILSIPSSKSPKINKIFPWSAFPDEISSIFVILKEPAQVIIIRGWSCVHC